MQLDESFKNHLSFHSILLPYLLAGGEIDSYGNMEDDTRTACIENA